LVRAERVEAEDDDVDLAGLEQRPLLRALLGGVGLRGDDAAAHAAGDLLALRSDHGDAVVRQRAEDVVVPFPDERPGDEDDGAADPPLLPRAGDDRQRRVGLADADVERDEAASLGEHAAGPGDLVGLSFGDFGPPAGDLQRLGRVGRDDAAAGDAVVRVDELLAAALIGRDPRPKRLVPLLPERDAPLGEVLLLRGLLLAGPRPRGAIGRLALGLEKLGVVVDVAEEGERLGGDRRLVGDRCSRGPGAGQSPLCRSSETLP
jgi:hypothetical protein